MRWCGSVLYYQNWRWLLMILWSSIMILEQPPILSIIPPSMIRLSINQPFVLSLLCELDRFDRHFIKERLKNGFMCYICIFRETFIIYLLRDYQTKFFVFFHSLASKLVDIFLQPWWGVVKKINASNGNFVRSEIWYPNVDFVNCKFL